MIYLTSDRVTSEQRSSILEEAPGTHQPCPEPFYRIPRRRLVVRIRLDLLQARDKVHVLRERHRHAEVPLCAEIEDGEHDERDVVRHERVRPPVALQED